MSGIKFQMGHKRHFANEFHLMASENDFSFDSYYSKFFKKGKGQPIIFMEREKHIRDSVLPAKQPSNALLSLPLRLLGKKRKQK